MKIFFILIISTNLIFSQNEKNIFETNGTAFTLAPKEIEVGIFQPLRYGFSETEEFSTHPILFFLMPNVEYKHLWMKTETSAFSIKHSLYYPTPLLKTISKKGIGGIISPEFEIPQMISIWNSFIYSFELSENKLITTYASLALSFSNKTIDERTTIDLPLVYHRMLVYYYNNYLLSFGTSLDGEISEKLNYSIDADLFFAPSAENNYSIEQSVLIGYQFSNKLKASVGYKFIFADYPFGKQKNIFPLIDLSWSFK